MSDADEGPWTIIVQGEYAATKSDRRWLESPSGPPVEYATHAEAVAALQARTFGVGYNADNPHPWYRIMLVAQYLIEYGA